MTTSSTSASFSIEPWVAYPIGPQLRRFLGISPSEYRGDHAPAPTDEQSAAFRSFLSQVFAQQAPQDQGEFVDLLEELTAMGLSSAAVELADLSPQFAIDGEFRACLALGSALMMESELDEALLLLTQAQALVPAESAPYVNLAAIYFSLNRDEEAQHWIERGLQIDVNQFRLWEILASIYLHENREEAGQKLQAKADRLHSYAGLSLAADLIDPNDRLLKAQYLGDAFNAGARDDDFLIEYTAALGLAQQFEKIPQLVWQMEHIEKKSVHWKLYAHAAQAYLALNKEAEAAVLIQRVAQSRDVPSNVLQDLQQIYDEQIQP